MKQGNENEKTNQNGKRLYQRRKPRELFGKHCACIFVRLMCGCGLHSSFFRSVLYKARAFALRGDHRLYMRRAERPFMRNICRQTQATRRRACRISCGTFVSYLSCDRGDFFPQRRISSQKACGICDISPSCCAWRNARRISHETKASRKASPLKGRGLYARNIRTKGEELLRKRLISPQDALFPVYHRFSFRG